MSEITYRSAHLSDVPAAVEVYNTARNDLIRRSGGTPPPDDRDGDLADFSHILRTGIFHVAENGRQVVGVAHAIVRDDLWFLSSFWVLPEYQRQGVGGPLLRAVWAEGQRAGANTWFVWSSSDLPAMASYLRLGMHPGYQVLRFGGALRTVPEAPTGYELGSLSPETAGAIDRQVRGTSRLAEHHYWAGLSGGTARAVTAGGATVGYYYERRGRIGPAAWTEETHAQPVLSLALRAAAGAEQVSLAVPGPNHAALRMTLDAGLRLTGFAHLLTSAPFGTPARYIPSGPAFY